MKKKMLPLPLHGLTYQALYTNRKANFPTLLFLENRLDLLRARTSPKCSEPPIQVQIHPNCRFYMNLSLLREPIVLVVSFRTSVYQ